MELQELINECFDYVNTNFKGEKISFSGKSDDLTLSFQDCEFYGDLRKVFEEFYNFLLEDNDIRERKNMEFRKGWDMAYGF